LTELAEYYRERAAEYDAVYAKPERQHDLARLHEQLPGLVAGRRVIEIAAGTGYWTRTLATSAAAITATDINTEPLAIAGARAYPPGRVTFATADAYALDQVPGEFDTAFAGFFWSHILRADLPRFLAGLQGRLGPGATVIVLDNRYVPGSSQPVTRTSEQGDTFQRRQLRDGRQYEIIKNFPGQDQFAADIAPVATGLTWTELRYFWLATIQLTSSAS